MMNSISPAEFEKLIWLHYQFLIDDYAYAIMDLSDWSCNFKGPNTKVSLLVEHSSVLSVAIQPIGEQASWLLRQNILPKDISVIVVSMCLDAGLKYHVARLHGRDPAQNIPVEMQRRADLLKKYCRRMLAGDFSEWRNIDTCMSQREYEFLNI